MTEGRLYTSEIMALQRVARLVSKDKRLNEKQRQHVLANVDYLVTTLSAVSVGKVDNEI